MLKLKIKKIGIILVVTLFLSNFYVKGEKVFADAGSPGDLSVEIFFSDGVPSPLPAIEFGIYNSSGVLLYPVTLTGVTSWVQNGIPEGSYTMSFADIAGYVTPAPRDFTISSTLANHVTATYHKMIGLKGNNRYTAENLHFTPSAERNIPEFILTRGEAAISIDGAHWQYSAAEVLVIGKIPPNIILEKTDGKSFVGPGDINNYTIKFNVFGGSGPSPYPGTLTDTIDIAKMDISVATYEFCDTSCSPFPIGQYSVDTINGTVTFNLNSLSLFKGTDYVININGIKVKDSPSVQDNDKITNTARLEVEGIIATAIDTDITAGAYAQEDFGGDIYAKGDLVLGDPNLFGGAGGYNAKYIIAADGAISAQSESDLIANTWNLENYEMRSGSGSDFDSVNCAEGSSCKVMEENIAKMLNSAETTILPTNLSFIDFSMSPDIVEGKVWKRDNPGGLTISALVGNDTVTVTGKGTIIIQQGDLHINSNIKYSASDPDSMIGFIVMEGDVIIDPAVTEINGIFYIPKGLYITGESPDVQLVSKGAFVARGFDMQRTRVGGYDSGVGGMVGIPVGGRIKQDDYAGFDAFCRAVMLDTAAIGVCKVAPNITGEYYSWDVSSFVFAGGGPLSFSTACSTVSCLIAKEPSEIFLYDSRILFNPPPGFGGRFSRSLD